MRLRFEYLISRLEPNSKSLKAERDACLDVLASQGFQAKSFRISVGGTSLGGSSTSNGMLPLSTPPPTASTIKDRRNGLLLRAYRPQSDRFTNHWSQLQLLRYTRCNRWLLISLWSPNASWQRWLGIHSGGPIAKRPIQYHARNRAWCKACIPSSVWDTPCV